MSLTIAARGKHRADDRIAELEAKLAQAEADNQTLIAANEDLVCELTRSIIRGSQDAIRRAEAEEENGRLKARVKELGDKVIRSGAEQQRLRRAVVNARPKIHPVPTDLVRPFAPVVVLPYVSPVPHRSTANDKTQELPVLDRPEQAVWPVYATPATT
ncbi:hypothetical protein [Streptomyces mirabilis]|uniref:hypothetical protein n=1 Tax=Streptomyces mirabilis TaxID=68239 RepID=UPI0036C5B384